MSNPMIIIGTSVLETSVGDFVQISINVFLITFLIRIIYKSAGFQHINLVGSVIFLALTSYTSIEAYKLNTIESMQTKIFDAKASNVEESEQNKYIKELEDEIKNVEKMDM